MEITLDTNKHASCVPQARVHVPALRALAHLWISADWAHSCARRRAYDGASPPPQKQLHWRKEQLIPGTTLHSR